MTFFFDEFSNNELLPSIMPSSGTLAILQGDKENVGVVIPSKNVLVWVNEIIWKLVADIIHLSLVVGGSAEQVVDAVHAAQEWKELLPLEKVLV